MADASQELITSSNHALVLIDYQPQMLFGVANMDRQLLKSNAIALAKVAKAFQVPTLLTSVETERNALARQSKPDFDTRATTRTCAPR